MPPADPGTLTPTERRILDRLARLPAGGWTTVPALAESVCRSEASVGQRVRALARRGLLGRHREGRVVRVTRAGDRPAGPYRPLPPAAPPAGPDPPPPGDDLAALRRRLAVEKLVLSRLVEITDRLTLTDAGRIALAGERGALARSIRMLRDLVGEVAAAREAAGTCFYMDNI